MVVFPFGFLPVLLLSSYVQANHLQVALNNNAGRTRVITLKRPLHRAPPSLSSVLALRGGSSDASFSRTATSATTKRPNWPFGPSSNTSQQQQQQQKSFLIVQDVTEGAPTAQALDAAEREEAKEMMNAFLTRDSRNSFIARVYAILTGQLVVTALSILLFSTRQDVAFWCLTKGKFVTTASMLLSMYAWLRMSFSPQARRQSPSKWRLLALFTIGEAFSVGLISSFYAFKSVLSAMATTSIATLTVTLYTLYNRNPKYDLSQWGAAISSCSIIYLLYGLVYLLSQTGILPRGFLPHNQVIYSSLGACLFSFYLAFHTRLIVSGKHTKYQMNEKDYVYGSMCLYVDVINIFLALLRMMGDERDR